MGVNIKNNLTGESLKREISKCNFKPSKYNVLLTINQFVPEGNFELIEDNDPMLDDWQYVISAGDGSEYKAGDKVYVDVSRFIKTVKDKNNPTRTIDVIDLKVVPMGDYTYTIISDSYILGIETEYPEINIKA